MDKDYQWSIKLDNGEIYVIHSETWEELRERREEVYKNIIGMTPIEKEIEDKYKGKTLEEIEDDLDPSWCDVHGVQMKERVKGDSKFYSHARQLGEGWDYCSGKGWKSDQK